MKAKKLGFLKKLALFISGVMGATIFPLIPANAVIVVEPIVTTPNSEFPDGVGVPLNLAPGQLIGFNIPDTSGLQNFINDTGLDITRIGVFLFPDFDALDEEIAWGDVNGDGQIGLSNIFSEVFVVPDAVFPIPDPSSPNGVGFTPAPFIQVSEGIIPNQKRFVFQFITSPDLTPATPGDNGPIIVGAVYDGITPVPESSNINMFGWLAILVGFFYRRKTN